MPPPPRHVKGSPSTPAPRFRKQRKEHHVRSPRREGGGVSDEANAGRADWPALWSKLGSVLGLAFVVALFAVLRPRTFLTADNFQIMLLQTAVVGTAALGMTLIIISGGIDLSIGSNIALCTVAIALFLQHHVPPAVAALGGIATGAACGAPIGLLITRRNLTPFIVTLGLCGAL